MIKTEKSPSTRRASKEKKICRICKENGKSFKIYQSHNPSDCKFKKKEDKREQKLYALVKEMNKKIKKFEKRTNHDERSDSDSDASWRQQDALNLGTPTGKRNLHVKSNLVSRKKGRYKNSAKISNSVKVKNTSNCYSNVFLNLEQHMANNLFVYNEHSFPAKIRKTIRAKITRSPKVVATLAYIKTVNGKIRRKTKMLRVLLDSGGSANLIQKRHIGENFRC